MLVFEIALGIVLAPVLAVLIAFVLALLIAGFDGLCTAADFVSFVTRHVVKELPHLHRDTWRDVKRVLRNHFFPSET